MSSLNDELLLERLVENVSKDLVRQYPINVVLALDYCYKSGKNIPPNYLSDLASRVVSKRINPSSKPLNIEESNTSDCLFIRAYESLLPRHFKSMVKNARTTKDFKGIIVLDLLSKKVSDYQRILSSNNSLDSKIFSLAEAYQGSVLENTFDKDYNRLRELSLKVNAELNKPFDADLAKYLQKVRKDLVNKLEVYSKHHGEMSVHEIQNLIITMRNSIDHKFRNYLYNTSQNYEGIKSSFESSIWDNEKRMNKLISLKSEIESVKHNYQMALSKDGVELCKGLELKMQYVIDAHYNLKYTLEEFKNIKKEVSDYYPELDHIFSCGIRPSSINRLNEIYLRLDGLASRRFPGYIPNDQQEDYYSRLGKVINNIKQKCAKRVTYLISQSTKYRHKADKAFFSWRTKKFMGELEVYNIELEMWSKCQVIKEI